MGQDPSADALLSSNRDEIGLAIPSVCVMEAISAFDWKRIERNRLKDELDKQLSQLQRCTDITTAQHLATELTKADLTNAALLSELFQRLDYYLLRITERADLIPLGPDLIRSQQRLVLDAELDRDDALILASILSHSQNVAVLKKAFLTANVKDFEKSPVRDLLADAGIKQFSSTTRTLAWTQVSSTAARSEPNSAQH